MFFKRKPDVEKIYLAGTHILFILQNRFFLNDNNIAVLDDCIKRYVGENSYRRFINKHKRLENPLLDGNESTAYYASNLIPPEPEVYPITVEDAQKKYSHILLDIVTLEVQYFFSVPVTIMINKHFNDKAQYYLPFFINLFSTFAKWSESGTDEAWIQGSKRYNEYVDQLNLDQTNIGGLATKRIFNIEDYFASYNLTLEFVSSIKHFEGLLKDL